MGKFVLCVALCLCSMVAFGQMPLDGIKDIIRGKRATVGVAVVWKSGMDVIRSG